jgi:hypothetical protein
LKLYKWLAGNIEIVDFPIKHGGSFHSLMGFNRDFIGIIYESTGFVHCHLVGSCNMLQPHQSKLVCELIGGIIIPGLFCLANDISIVHGG